MKMILSDEQALVSRYLRSFRTASDRLDSAFVFLEKAEAARSSISASIGTFSMGGEQRDRMLGAMLRMDSAIDDIGGLTAELSDRFKEVEGLISEVQESDPRAGRALRDVYVSGLTVKEAAEKEGCSRKTEYENLKRGLDIAYDLL